MSWVLLLSLLPQNDVKPRPSGGKGGKAGTQAAAKITVKGTEREYRLVVPEGLDPQSPTPILFAFHGLKDSKDLMPVYSRLDKTAAKDGVNEKMWKFFQAHPMR